MVRFFITTNIFNVRQQVLNVSTFLAGIVGKHARKAAYKRWRRLDLGM